MVIDAHVHLYWPALNADPGAWASARGEAHWADLATRRRKDGRPVQLFPDVGALLREMDAAGVDRAVLLGWYWETARSCEEQNAFFAECVRAHPDRLAAAVTVHPPSGAAHVEREFERAREAGFRGVGELSPHAQGHPLDHPAFARALALAGSAGWPVTLHVTDPSARPYPGQVSTPLEDFDRLAREFPATTFILAHWGGFPPWRQPNVYCDTAASPLSHGPDVWRRGVGALGADRVLFGSDFPLRLYPRLEDGAGMARAAQEARAGLAPAEAAAVLGGNAARWFGRRPR
ncbi:MAG TPA: amidohydrolase family protein [Opitutaceae bacterium]|jgi:hypothetical protein|nr:amidohydrolase family protein [Opitutaceae bacterium]